MIVSQLLVTLAVHAHPAPAVTRSVPVESSAPTLSLAGEMVMELLTGAAREQNVALVLVTHEPRIAAYAAREVFVRDGATADIAVAA